MSRLIGMVHRVKKTVEGESRPTMLALKQGEQTEVRELEAEDHEKDFLLGVFPLEYRPVEPSEDVSKYPPHHLKWRKLSEDEDSSTYHVSQIREGERGLERAVKLPLTYDGLKSGDTVLAALGGSGDRFSAALSRRGEEIGAEVRRITPFNLKEKRESDDTSEDHLKLIEIFAAQPELFAVMTPRDRELVRLKESFIARQEAQEARKGCAQRLRQRLIGRIFLNEEGRYSEGSIEDEYDAMKASDTIFLQLSEEEESREKEIKKLMRGLDLWPLFEKIEGCGEVLAARLVRAIQDIRRFESPAKLKAFCGVHVLPDGRIPRRRTGEIANWHPEGRQALYLLADQWNRRAKSVWGLKLREYKVKLRAAHPEVMCKECGVRWEDCQKQTGHTRKYTNGHIHKMALWRTMTKFTEWLFREWWRLEHARVAPAPKPVSGETKPEPVAVK